jgi:hypothetical protein
MLLSELDAQALDAALVAAPFVVGGWQRAQTHLAAMIVRSVRL